MSFDVNFSCKKIYFIVATKQYTFTSNCCREIPDVFTIATYYYYWYSALGPVWAETRVQSGDCYGSGTLHPGQVLRGSLPLLSPQTHYYSENLVAPGIEPGTSVYVARNSDH